VQRGTEAGSGRVQQCSLKWRTGRKPAGAWTWDRAKQKTRGEPIRGTSTILVSKRNRKHTWVREGGMALRWQMLAQMFHSEVLMVF
jgi:hypothetical protein